MKDRNYLPIFVVALVIGLLGICYFYWASMMERSLALSVNNVFFGGDSCRVVTDMTDVDAVHYRANVHPIFILMTLPLGLSPALLVPLAAVLSLVFFALAIRRWGVPAWQVPVYVLLLGTTSTYMFWGAVPETHIFGGLGVALACFTAAYFPRKWWAMIPAGLISGGVNLPTLGPMMALALHSLKRCRWCAVLLVVIVVGLVYLAQVQQSLYPSATLWFDRASYNGESRYLAFGNPKVDWTLRPFNILAHFFAFNLILPSFATSHVDWTPLPMFTVKSALTLPFVLWMVVWASAVYSFIRYKLHRDSLTVCLLLGLATQLVFYLAYSVQSFIYVANWTVVIIALLGLVLRPALEHRPRLQFAQIGALSILAVLQFATHWQQLSGMIRFF